MKQVEKISLSSVPFSIEKDAYDRLCAYLADINAHYKDSEGGDEVVDGIEERMAELFKEKTLDDGVINIGLVEEVIGRLGSPADIDSGSPEETEGQQRKKPRGSASRRLYRDRDNKVLFGVCSGLGAYFDIDRVYIRLLFFILFAMGFFTEGIFFVVVIALYLALAISMPAAVTVEDKCRMYGSGVDISGIEERIRYRSAAGTGKAVRDSGVRSRHSSSVAASVITKVFGCIVLITGISGLIFGSLTALWVRMFNDYVAFETDFEFMQLYNAYVLPFTHSVLFMILLYLIVLIPFIWMIYCGIKLIFSFKSPKWHPGIVMLFAWLILVIVALVVVSFRFYDLWYIYSM